MKYLLLVVLLASCAHLDKTDKMLLGCVVVTQTLDGVTTSRALKNPDVHEANQLAGSQPSDLKIGLFKLVTVGAVYGLSELFPKERKYILGIGCAAGAGATIWNLQFQ